MTRDSYYISVRLQDAVYERNGCYGSPREVQAYLKTLKNQFITYYLWSGRKTISGMEFRLKYIIHNDRMRSVESKEELINKHTKREHQS